MIMVFKQLVNLSPISIWYCFENTSFKLYLFKFRAINYILQDDNISNHDNNKSNIHPFLSLTE